MDCYNSSTSRDLYTCQLFGFTSRAFVDFFYNVLSKEASDALYEIEDQIKNLPLISKDISEEEIKKGSEKLQQLCGKNLAKNVDRLELYLQNNIFTIPVNVTLPEDKIQQQQSCTKEYEADLDRKIAEVQKKIKASFYSRLKMENELTNIENVHQQAVHLLEKMKTYSDRFNLFNDDHVKTLCQSGKLCIDEVNNVLSVSTSYQDNTDEDYSMNYTIRKKQRKS